MTVAELINLLENQPQDLQVAFEMYSEQKLLEPDEISIVELCEPRSDGWIQNSRPDMPKRKYLLFPGN